MEVIQHVLIAVALVLVDCGADRGVPAPRIMVVVEVRVRDRRRLPDAFIMTMKAWVLKPDEASMREEDD